MARTKLCKVITLSSQQVVPKGRGRHSLPKQTCPAHIASHKTRKFPRSYKSITPIPKVDTIGLALLSWPLEEDGHIVIHKALSLGDEDLRMKAEVKETTGHCLVGQNRLAAVPRPVPCP